MQEHLPGYQKRDWEVVDYQMYQDAETGLWFRGPQPRLDERSDFFACLGGAQTFGCFCQRPFAALLARRLNLPVLNFGYGGAGPHFFLKYPDLLKRINKAKFAIVQVMSGRSESNSLFESGGLELLTRRTDGTKVGATAAYQRLLDEADLDSTLPPRLRRIFRTFVGPAQVRALIAETRANWLANYRRLLAQIEVPTILFWFARRHPWINRSDRAWWFWQRYDHANGLFGAYPQLVSQAQVKPLRPLASMYVECVTSRGAPQKLVSRFTGAPVLVDYGRDREDLAQVGAVNHYYPSPEMHEDAARKLLPGCQALLRAGHARAMPSGAARRIIVLPGRGARPGCAP
jgi:hypothetical protein